MNQTRVFSTRNLVLMGMLGALSAVLMLFKFPVPFALGFYTIDFSEVPVLIGAFALSPVAGIIIELIKNLLNLIINGTQTAGVGELANFISGSILVFTAATIYRRKPSRNGAVIGLTVATIVMSIASCFINYFITLPVYFVAFGMNWDTIMNMSKAINGSITNPLTFLVLSVLPFNLLKCGLSSLITLLLYKHVSPILKGSIR
ncbi:MAG: ECF transporter S component [bacterium]|nr:ECF transporter S component [bacterium]